MVQVKEVRDRCGAKEAEEEGMPSGEPYSGRREDDEEVMKMVMKRRRVERPEVLGGQASKGKTRPRNFSGEGLRTESRSIAN